MPLGVILDGAPTLPPPNQTGRERLHHPTVGDLELDYEAMELTATMRATPLLGRATLRGVRRALARIDQVEPVEDGEH